MGAASTGLCCKVCWEAAEWLNVGGSQAVSDFKGRHFEGEIVLWATSWSVRGAAMIRPLAASTPTCSFFQARRRWVPCFSASHSPGPHSLTPVLSTRRSMAPAEVR